ncbi:MAG: hypothetical protein IJF19_02670 [Clostridia bacterium]|nr:hypothetical protein [Clostridia bacterium]
MSDINVQAKSKEVKGFLKNKKMLIFFAVLGVLLIAGLIVGGSFLIPKDIAGAWELVVNPEVPEATADEVNDADKVYYVFDKPDRYGRGEYRTCYQGGVEHFVYELLKEDSVNKINLGTEDMEYKISGSKLLRNAELTIIYPQYTDESTGVSYEAQEYIFKQAKNPRYEKQSYKDYETDSKLLYEKWTSNERTLAYYFYSIPYVETVEFTDDGIMVIRYESSDLALDRYMYYAYTAKDGTLTFSPVTEKETKYTVGYEFDENGNLKFINDTTVNSIFADAFFGEFAFYTSENLPEPTTVGGDDMYLAE